MAGLKFTKTLFFFLNSRSGLLCSLTKGSTDTLTLHDIQSWAVMTEVKIFYLLFENQEWGTLLHESSSQLTNLTTRQFSNLAISKIFNFVNSQNFSGFNFGSFHFWKLNFRSFHSNSSKLFIFSKKSEILKANKIWKRFSKKKTNKKDISLYGYSFFWFFLGWWTCRDAKSR